MWAESGSVELRTSLPFSSRKDGEGSAGGNGASFHHARGKLDHNVPTQQAHFLSWFGAHPFAGGSSQQSNDESHHGLEPSIQLVTFYLGSHPNLNCPWKVSNNLNSEEHKCRCLGVSCANDNAANAGSSIIKFHNSSS
mmetsp:Transcript_15566/g.33973  ORF Transcript_15566/g.33973 Transcript_15566/m.33973 type:complete len:138 (-) Transcript_15566:50-463(-)